jgi:hypothetical protein
MSRTVLIVGALGVAGFVGYRMLKARRAASGPASATGEGAPSSTVGGADQGPLRPHHEVQIGDPRAARTRGLKVTTQDHRRK